MSKKHLFTTFRIIRIDGEADLEKNPDLESAVESAVAKVIADANAHKHTIENGVSITDITDCGESI